MKRLFILLSISFLSAFARDTLAVKIADLVAKERYNEAKIKIEHLRDSISADYWAGALLVTRWNDLRQDVDRKKAEEYFSRLTSLNADSVTDLEKLYYIAQAQGQIAVRLAREGSWLSAVSMSRQSVDILEDILERDSSFVDAKTGIAVYRYWIADKMPFYSWLNFRFSDKSESIESLKEAARKGVYGKALAMQQLFWIYINEENFAEAAKISEQFAKEYPGTRLALWLKYFIFAYLDEPDSALQYLNSLENSYERTSPVSRLNLLEIRMKQYEYCCRLLDYQGMAEAKSQVEKMNPTAGEKLILKTKFEKYQLLLKECASREQKAGKNSLH